MSQSTLDGFERETFASAEGHVHHPLLRAGAVQARASQLDLARRAVNESLLVVLPTGLGKTAIALLVAAERLRAHPDGQVVVVAPTRPLAHQHARAFRDALALKPGAVVELTGDVSPRSRAAAFPAARVVVSTPQGLANDVAAGRVSLARVRLLVVDECHRAVGDYPYVPLCEAFRAQRADARILGLTASPGASRARIREVMETLGGPAVEARDREDEDVQPYVKGLDVRYQSVRLPEPARAARDAVAKVLAERVQKLRPFIPRREVDAERIGKALLLQTGDAIRARLGKARGAQKAFCFAAMQNHAVAVHALHALELIETQGLRPFAAYVERVAQQPETSRAQTAFASDPRIHRALHLAHAADASHPKENALMDALARQFEKKPESLVLVFAQYRDTVRTLLTRIERAGYPAARFVGQSGADGLTQDQQQALLRSFEAGRVRVLVATSVAEEGLHVPNVDLVVLYEPVVSEIRTIQRRGRTGRSAVGDVLVLVTEESRDETHLRIEAAREAEMRRIVHGISRGATP